MLTQLRSKNQITIPADLINKMELHQGSKLEVEMTDDGKIIITPVVTVEKKWLDDVGEALKQVENGDVSKAMEIEELLESLDEI
ncbi:MAG: AbrB/MazE/SpoVT family DNA-binding domain-containing protein [Bacillota bacterium]|nr:AbrB/MazE/SpoVT family DNA-binding domain-containing protein [Bacillota bacterium]